MSARNTAVADSVLGAHSEPATAAVELITRRPIEMKDYSGWLLLIARANYTGDPLAEALVDELRAHQVPLMNPLPGMRKLAAGGNKPCQDFLAEVDTVPDWVDFDLIGVGARAAARNMLPYLLAIGLGSLPDTYLAPTSAEVLRGTRRFRTNVHRRVYESATLFHQILIPGALKPGAQAWTTIVRLRLFHTLTRMQVKKRGGWHWDSMPISQLETSIGTQLFGSAPLVRMDQLGAFLSRREKNGYYMLWRYVTFLLGAGQLIFEDPADQLKFEQLIAGAFFDEPAQRYNRRPDAAGKELTGDLLASFQGSSGGGIRRRLLEALLIRLQGEERAEALGVSHSRALRAPRNVAFTVVSKCTRALSFALWAIPPAGNGVARRSIKLMGDLVSRGLKDKKPEFQVVPLPHESGALV